MTKTDLTPSQPSLEELQGIIKNELQAIQNKDCEVWAAYSRLSREEKHGHSYSLEIQPDRAEAYAREHGADRVVIYADPYRTGSNSKRKDLQRLIKDIKARRVDVVVVHRLDRLYRNLESLLYFVHLCKKHGVRLVSVTEQLDTNAWWGRLVLYVLGALAEMYIHQTSTTTREAKRERIARGLHNGHIPIGYCNGLCATCTDPNGPGYCPLVGGLDRVESQRGRVAVPHPIDRHLILLVAELYLKRWSYREIANHLNQNTFTLPDETKVKFRPKGTLGKKAAKDFSRASIRSIIGTPFYAGLVPRYPRPVLSMEDNVEAPYSVKAPGTEINSRQLLEVQQGQHEAIISLEAWKQMQQIRKSKGKTPSPASKPKREYLLTGIAECWECHQHDARRAALRGSTGGANGTPYYRCATMQDRYIKRSKKADASLLSVPDSLSSNPLARHTRSSLRADRMDTQANVLLEGFVIPREWYETIMAYYVSDEGMTEFERNGHNLRASLGRYRQLFLAGQIDQAEFDAQSEHIARQLQMLQPSASPAAREIIPWLEDFPALWAQLSDAERRLLLPIIFNVLRFDKTGELRQVVANAPFGQSLNPTRNVDKVA